jgi:ribokinase
MDLVVRAPRYPRRGENLIALSLARFPGGKGANQAVAAARLGARVSMIGAVGDDPFGREFLSLLAQEGIDATHVRVRQGEQTGVGLITIDESPGAEAANTIIVALGANASLLPADADAGAARIAEADVLLLQLENPPQTVARAAAIARDAGTTVILNAAPAQAVDTALMANVDALILNEEEARAVCPGLDVEALSAAAPAVAALGPRCVVVTLGRRGAWAVIDGEPAQVEPFAVAAIDTVGAGDAFCGAFAARWAQEQARGGIDRAGILDAATWGCAAGALAVTRRGAIPSLPLRNEVVDLLRRR